MHERTLVLGGGPAGLTAAYMLATVPTLEQVSGNGLPRYNNADQSMLTGICDD